MFSLHKRIERKLIKLKKLNRVACRFTQFESVNRSILMAKPQLYLYHGVILPISGFNQWPQIVFIHSIISFFRSLFYILSIQLQYCWLDFCRFMLVDLVTPSPQFTQNIPATQLNGAAIIFRCFMSHRSPFSAFLPDIPARNMYLHL